jgi:acyl carrier protein
MNRVGSLINSEELQLDEIIRVLAKKIAQDILKNGTKSLRADEALISSGLIDSFSLVDLAMLVEDEFGVRIEDTELNSQTFDTLEQLAVLITERKNK